MTASSRPPRKLTAIIGVVVASKAFITFVPPLSIASLLGLTVLCFLAWNAYDGKHSAAKFLGVCLLILGILGVFSGLSVLTASGAFLFRVGGHAPVWGLLHAVLSILEIWAGTYILRSDEVKNFYQRREGFLL